VKDVAYATDAYSWNVVGLEVGHRQDVKRDSLIPSLATGQFSVLDEHQIIRWTDRGLGLFSLLLLLADAAGVRPTFTGMVLRWRRWQVLLMPARRAAAGGCNWTQHWLAHAHARLAATPFHAICPLPLPLFGRADCACGMRFRDLPAAPVIMVQF
jgi:hypothetical protein